MHVNALIVRPQAVRELPADRVQGFGVSRFLASRLQPIAMCLHSSGTKKLKHTTNQTQQFALQFELICIKLLESFIYQAPGP